MHILKQFKTVGLEFLDLVFPITCIVCGKDGTYLCENCFTNKITRLDKQQCLVCQKPAPFGKTHAECVSRNGVDGIISALSYKDPNVKNIIEIFKYNFISDLAKPLADLTYAEIIKQNLGEYFSEFIIVPVPLHIRRFNWRGFNQASMLAKAMQEKLGCDMREDLVTRIRHTKPQTKFSSEERKNNVANAFDSIREVSGKKFLIVDDVVTTGSTINEIARLLKKSGAMEVWGLTAARG